MKTCCTPVSIMPQWHKQSKITKSLKMKTIGPLDCHQNLLPGAAWHSGHWTRIPLLSPFQPSCPKFIVENKNKRCTMYQKVYQNYAKCVTHTYTHHKSK